MKTINRLIAVLVFLTLATPARAAEINVLCSNGLKAVVDELVPQFEQKTGHKVVLKFEPSTQIQKRIEAGEAFDLAVMTTPLIDQEIKAGRLAADSRTIIARSGLGLSDPRRLEEARHQDRRVVQAGAARREIDHLRHRRRERRAVRGARRQARHRRAGEAEVQPAADRVARRRGRRERHRRDRRRAGQRDPAGQGRRAGGAVSGRVQSYVVMTAGVSTQGERKGRRQSAGRLPDVAGQPRR